MWARLPTALLLLWSLPASAAETLRIDIGTEPSTVTVQAEGLQSGVDADDAGFKPVATDKALLQRSGGRLLLNNSPLLFDAVRFHARGAIRAGATVVRGDVVVRVDGDGLQLVNVIDLEDYLVGVLGSEMPASFPDEALKAQAVAARTYALNKKLAAYGLRYHLGASVLSQVYKGLASEDERTRAIVRATRGVVLTWHLTPIEAYFHSSCGGRTESGQEALGRDLPYLRPVDCPCGSLPSSRWSLTLALKELEAAMGRLSSGVRSMVVADRSPTGRARRVTLAPGRVIDAVTFRERLGYGRVKSLSFDVQPAGDKVKLVGRGFGHGAGLCQWGAKALAEQGQGFREILAHYYPNTELQTLY